jgi:hypothetical protein
MRFLLVEENGQTSVQPGKVRQIFYGCSVEIPILASGFNVRHSLLHVPRFDLYVNVLSVVLHLCIFGGNIRRKHVSTSLLELRCHRWSRGMFGLRVAQHLWISKPLTKSGNQANYARIPFTNRQSQPNYRWRRSW